MQVGEGIHLGFLSMEGSGDKDTGRRERVSIVIYGLYWYGLKMSCILFVCFIFGFVAVELQHDQGKSCN